MVAWGWFGRKVSEITSALFYTFDSTLGHLYRVLGALLLGAPIAIPLGPQGGIHSAFGGNHVFLLAPPSGGELHGLFRFFNVGSPCVAPPGIHGDPGGGESTGRFST